MDLSPLLESSLCETCSWCVYGVDADDQDIYLCSNKKVKGDEFVIADRLECDEFEKVNDSMPLKYFRVF